MLKMDVIKTVNDLPEWFRTKTYKRDMDAVEWYREIRRRDYGLAVVDFLINNPNVTNHAVQDIFYIFHGNLRKDWPFFHIPQKHYPVENMSRREAIYMGACLEDEISKTEKSLTHGLITLYKKEEEREPPRTIYSPEYTQFLSKYLDYLASDCKENEFLDGPVYESMCEVGNPFLSYSQALRGRPLIVDPTYDDETLIEHFKEWLAEHRQQAGEKARRRFDQEKDFRKWDLYRIREVVDLDTWARINNVEILDRVIADAAWADAPDDISPIDILRTTTRKKIKEVFNEEVTSRFYAQLMLERGANFLDE